MNDIPPETPDDASSLVPDVVRQLLSPEEDIEARYEMKGSEAYATPKWLIILRGGQTTNIAYDRIATTRDISKTNTWLILAGAALILLGVLAKSRRIEIFVTGLKEPVVLDGAREVLGPLAKKLAEKRGRLSF